MDVNAVCRKLLCDIDAQFMRVFIIQTA